MTRRLLLFLLAAAITLSASIPLSQAQHQQQPLPPSLAAAAARAAAAAHAHPAALGGGDGSGSSERSGARGSYQPAQHHYVRQKQQQRRHLLAPKNPSPAEGVDPRFANFTVGGIRATREDALRKALMDGYDNAVFPWSEAGAAQLLLNVALHRILDVDLYGGTMKLAVWLRMEWWDPRLTWDQKEWNVTKLWFLNQQQGDTELWEPDIVLWNAANPILYTLGQEPMGVNASGRVFWSRPGVFDVACNFKGLSAFPFGHVGCQLELGAWTYGPWYVNVSMLGKGFDIGGSVTSGESATWQEYKISGCTARRHEYPPYPCCPSESDWPVVLIDITLERQNLIYMMKVIVPQIILTAIGFSTFWLSPACGERLGLAVTVPLAVAVYDLLTYSQLPVSNKVTLVSALGMTAFLFTMAVLVENAFVIQLWHYTEHTYFKGASVFLNTAVAYREQLVWVNLLGCIHQLKIEVARRQLAALQAKKSASPNKSQHGRGAFMRSLSGSKNGSGAIVNRWHNIVSNSQEQQQQSPQSPQSPSQQQQQQQQQQESLEPPVVQQQQQSKSSVKWQGLARSALADNNHNHQQPATATADVVCASSAEQQQQQQEQQSAHGSFADTLPLNDADSSAAGAAAAAGSGDGSSRGGAGDDRTIMQRSGSNNNMLGSSPQSPSAVMLSPTRSEVLKELEQLQGATQDDGAGDSLLLKCTTKDQLRFHLHNILNSTGDKSLARMQHRIQKAFVVFGEDVVCNRLHAVLSGGQGGLGPSDTASDAGSEAADTSPQNLHARLAGEFNRRWQLLSSMIDHTCRYLFISAYVLCMIVLTVSLIMSQE